MKLVVDLILVYAALLPVIAAAVLIIARMVKINLGVQVFVIYFLNLAPVLGTVIFIDGHSTVTLITKICFVLSLFLLFLRPAKRTMHPLNRHRDRIDTLWLMFVCGILNSIGGMVLLLYMHGNENDVKFISITMMIVVMSIIASATYWILVKGMPEKE